LYDGYHHHPQTQNQAQVNAAAAGHNAQFAAAQAFAQAALAADPYK
jgi:hypothetical protein